MHGYKCFYNSNEFDVYADSLYAAKQKAVAHWKVKRNKEHMISVVLCEKNGETVTHSTAEF